MSGRGHGDKLARKREAALAALMTCGTVEKAARKAGVSAATLHRWLALEDFAADYKAARRQAFEDSIGQLQAASGVAVQALVGKLKKAPAAVVVQAARAILVLAREGVELGDVLERLEALERAQRSGEPLRLVPPGNA